MGAWEHRGQWIGRDWRMCVVAIILGGIERESVYAQDVAVDCKASLILR
jgi:hypothetical protein